MSAADVWIVTLPEDDGSVARALSLLTADEQSRASRFRRDEDRRAYVYSHAALRVRLGRERGAPFDDRPFATGPRGKPFIPGAPHFNLSRAGARAAMGVCADGAIGVDIERIARGATSVEVGESRFSAAERAWLDRAEGDEARRQRYLRLWVIREALLKAQGVGLSGELADGEIAIAGDEPLLRATSEWRIVEAPASVDACVRGFIAAAAVPRGCGVTWRCVAWASISGRLTESGCI